MTRTRLFVGSAFISLIAMLSGCPTDPVPDDVPVVPFDTNGNDVPAPRDAPIPTTVPIFRNPVSTPDAELAQMALQIMGSTDAGATRILCNDCHDLTREQIRYWRALSDTALTNCLPDLTLAGGDTAASAVVSCIRGGDGRYTTMNLGIFATAGDLDSFRYVFAHGAGGDMTAHDTFLAEAAMPRDYPPLTQAEFDIVAEWFIRGVPGLEAIVPADPPPTECAPRVYPRIGEYVADRATTGWSAVNRTAGMLMYGCAGATRPQDCLADETLSSATAFGADWDTVGAAGVTGARSRVLFTTDYASAYWTRGSADGRFISHGAARAPAFRFVDLAGGGAGAGTGRVITGNANYDGFFFPDDAGFVIQSDTLGPRVCEMSVLTTGMPASIDFGTQCGAGGGIGLYEHLGAALGGGDYWAIDSTTSGGTIYATYDNGGQGPTLSNPEATFSSRAVSTVRFLTNSGTAFRVSGSTNIAHPFEGDAVISPSLGLLVTRQAGPGGRQLGYVVREVTTTGSGGTRTISGTEVGRYCINGGKPGFSYDERWLAIHHYIEPSDAVDLGFSGPDDPAFAEYRTRGGANIHLIDMATGNTYRVTNMGPGQYALFPHFRSDGWLLYMVRTESATPEHIVASDAALLAPPP